MTCNDVHPDAIPVFVGVTGHRLLRMENEDRIKLRRAIEDVFLELKTLCPNTDIILLTALAQGADQFAAEVARENGTKYAAVLPMSQKEYINRGNDFSDEAKENFLRLAGSAAFTYVLPRVGDDETQFRECARFISDSSHIVLALWDGVLTGNKAGAAVAVCDSLQGRGYRAEKDHGISIPDTRPVYHIYTPGEGFLPKKYDYGLRKLFPDPLFETGKNWFTLDDWSGRDDDLLALFDSSAGTENPRILDERNCTIEQQKNFEKQLKSIDTYNGLLNEYND